MAIIDAFTGVSVACVPPTLHVTPPDVTRPAAVVMPPADVAQAATAAGSAHRGSAAQAYRTPAAGWRTPPMTGRAANALAPMAFAVIPAQRRNATATRASVDWGTT